MRKAAGILGILLALTMPASLGAATVNINCTATVQSIGACAAADNGKAGVFLGFWVDLTDEAPGDADVNSDAADLRDAICATFGISTGCTSAAADGAIRRYLETLVVNHRLNKKKAAVALPSAPTLDGQANP